MIPAALPATYAATQNVSYPKPPKVKPYISPGGAKSPPSPFFPPFSGSVSAMPRCRRKGRKGPLPRLLRGLNSGGRCGGRTSSQLPVASSQRIFPRWVAPRAGVAAARLQRCAEGVKLAAALFARRGRGAVVGGWSRRHLRCGGQVLVVGKRRFAGAYRG